MTEYKKDTRAKDAALHCFYNISQLMRIRERASRDGGSKDFEEAQTTIQESAYGVATRSDWTSISDELEPYEYLITLAGGGAAVRLRGLLSDMSHPYTAYLEYQDWFMPWTEYVEITEEDSKILLDYARVIFPW